MSEWFNSLAPGTVLEWGKLIVPSAATIVVAWIAAAHWRKRVEERLEEVVSQLNSLRARESEAAHLLKVVWEDAGAGIATVRTRLEDLGIAARRIGIETVGSGSLESFHERSVIRLRMQSERMVKDYAGHNGHDRRMLEALRSVVNEAYELGVTGAERTLHGDPQLHCDTTEFGRKIVLAVVEADRVQAEIGRAVGMAP